MPRQWLGKNIGNLIICIDIRQFKEIFVEFFSNEIVHHVDVLRSFVKFHILDKPNRTLIVDEHRWNFAFRPNIDHQRLIQTISFIA